MYVFYKTLKNILFHSILQMWVWGSALFFREMPSDKGTSKVKCSYWVIFIKKNKVEEQNDNFLDLQRVSNREFFPLSMCRNANRKI